MKKIFALIFVSSLCLQINAQVMQASIGVGSQPNRVKIYLKSNVTQSPSSISTLQFNIGVQASGILVAPSLVVLSSAFPAVTWQITTAYNEGGFWNYNIFTASSPLTPNFTANTEFEAMELEFSNGSPSVGNVALVSLPDGGTTTPFAYFFCSGTVGSNGLSGLYYARTGVTVNNQNSYDQTNGVAQTGTSSAIISSIVLPVKFLGFNAVKKDNNAVLTWQIENESDLTDHYEVERSLNGADFTKVNTVSPKNNGNSSNSYDLTDINISALRSAGIFYYRIKQFDKDGRFIYSPIKSVRLTSNGIVIAAYPNPIKDFTNLTIDLEQDAEANITINDAAGKQVQNLQMQLFKGPNIKKINLAHLASGSYMLKVQTPTELKTLSLVKTN